MSIFYYLVAYKYGHTSHDSTQMMLESFKIVFRQMQEKHLHSFYNFHVVVTCWINQFEERRVGNKILNYRLWIKCPHIIMTTINIISRKMRKVCAKISKLLPCYSYVVLAFQKLKHTIDLIIWHELGYLNSMKFEST